MKIGIYTPYLDSFGGGERYVLTVAEILSQQYQVDLLLDNHLNSLNHQKLLTQLADRLNLDLSRVNHILAPVGAGSNFFKRIIFLRNYDLIFYLTDGSVFYSTAKKNFIHFQVPFKNLVAKSIWGKIKLSTWNLAICNSLFTQKIIEKEWKIKSKVIYPPVDVEKIKPLEKKRYILSVGRFTSFSKSKKQEEMIDTYKLMIDNNKLKDWSLHLAGSVEGDENYLERLKEKAKGYQIFFYPDLEFSKLVKLYGESSIYWHAAGLGEEDPTKMEHFGITTVEAMAGGCVPIVINKGGQPEIVEDYRSGLLWETTEQLKELTLSLVNDQKLMDELSKNAISRSGIFSKMNFTRNIEELVKSI